MTAASTISPSFTAKSPLRTVTVPSPSTCSMRTVPAAAMVTDFSVERKSPPVMVATLVLESADQAPME